MIYNMINNRNTAYLWYILRHKWFVYLASKKTGCSFWRALIHDWTKFLPIEWKPYAETFYNHDGSKRYEESPEFHGAWLHHQKWNKHHWQYWMLYEDDGGWFATDMPEKYILEMVADWMGAGRAITGKWEVVHWYNKNQSKIVLSSNTRARVKELLFSDPIYRSGG